MMELYVDELVDIDYGLMCSFSEEMWGTFIGNAPRELNCELHRDFLIPYGVSMISRVFASAMNELFSSVNAKREFRIDMVSIDPTDIYDSLDNDVTMEAESSSASEVGYLWVEYVFDVATGGRVIGELEKRFREAREKIVSALLTVPSIGIWTDVYAIEGCIWDKFHVVSIVQPWDYRVLIEGIWQSYAGGEADISHRRMVSNTETFFLQNGLFYTDSMTDLLVVGQPYQLCALTESADRVVVGC